MIQPISSLDEEKQELAALLAYPEIARSANLVRLLTFVCERYFEGKADEIRESSIAIQALGRRGTDFDSHADPIVRVTAHTLRKRLDAYYNQEGRGHGVRLVLPVGQYVPKFVAWAGETCDPLLGVDVDHPSADIASSDLPLEDDPVGVSQRKIEVEASRLSAFRKLASEWRKPTLMLSLIVAVSIASFWSGRRSTMKQTEAAADVIWGEPVWSDEFNGPAGDAPDASKWSFDVGRSAEFRSDMVTYCAPGSSNPAPCNARRPNAVKDGAGHLIISAIKAKNGLWTSARIKTEGLRDFQYGRIEARMKLPVGAGLWPAFWMLGSNFTRIGWPNSGSVDLMENVSTPNRFTSIGPTMIRSAVHGPGYSGGNALWQNYILPGGSRIDDDNFHTYGMIWSPNMVQFYVDDPSNVFFVKTASDVPAGAQWVLNNRFFLIMDLGIGGEWAGAPDDSTPDPSIVLVDYVRVYKASPVPGPRISVSPIAVHAGSSAAATIELSARMGSGRMYLSCFGAPLNSTCTLENAVVDFTNSGTQQNTLKIQTGPTLGMGKFVTPPGTYALTITATTVSGDTTSLNVPLRIE